MQSDGIHIFSTASRFERAFMKYPDLIPLYANLLCNETISEELEDVSQYLFQSAVDTRVILTLDDDTERMMKRLLEFGAAATADTRLHCLSNKLEALPLCQGSCPAPRDDLSFSEGGTEG